LSHFFCQGEIKGEKNQKAATPLGERKRLSKVKLFSCALSQSLSGFFFSGQLKDEPNSPRRQGHKVPSQRAN
jgi:hypothetical protein